MNVERWRKIAGKYHVGARTERKTYGPGQPDGDIVEFPAGKGPVNDPSWELVQSAPDPDAMYPESGLRIVPRGGGWFDVENIETGQMINDSPMRKAEAEALVDRKTIEAEAGDEEEEEPDDDEEGDGDEEDEDEEDEDEEDDEEEDEEDKD